MIASDNSFLNLLLAKLGNGNTQSDVPVLQKLTLPLLVRIGGVYDKMYISICDSASLFFSFPFLGPFGW